MSVASDLLAQMASFFQKYHEDVERMREQLDDIMSLSSKLRAEVNKDTELLNKCEERVKMLEVSMEDRRWRANNSSGHMDPLTLAALDNCEVKVSGIPCSLSDSNEDVLNRIFTVLDLLNFPNFVLEIRKWKPPRSSASGALDRRATRSLIVTLATPTVRDHLLTTCADLRKHSVDSIFGEGGSGRIYVQGLWPKPLYELLKKSIAAAKDLKYARPLVINYCVVMRQTAKSEHILISCEADLLALKARSSTN